MEMTKSPKGHSMRANRPSLTKSLYRSVFTARGVACVAEDESVVSRVSHADTAAMLSTGGLECADEQTMTTDGNATQSLPQPAGANATFLTESLAPACWRLGDGLEDGDDGMQSDMGSIACSLQPNECPTLQHSNTPTLPTPPTAGCPISKSRPTVRSIPRAS